MIWASRSESYFAAGRFALLSVSEQIDTRSAGGRLVLSVLGAVSQWEREAIGERTSAALQHKAAQGECMGGAVPSGYRVDGERLAEEPAEQATIREARELRAQGLALRGVAAGLSAVKGYRSRTGHTFAPVRVQRMIAA